MISLLESYDALAFTSVIDERLTAATARLGRARGLAPEKAWLEAAVARLAETRAPHVALMQKAAQLPELEVVRAAQRLGLQNEAVDAVERLQAGITFHAGSRMPLLDALFGKLKLTALRRADPGDFETFCADFEKRLSTQYSRRLFVTPAFEFAIPVLEQVRTAFAQWRGSLSAPPLPDDEAAALAEALREAATQVELPLRQVRLLAEAALAPLAGAFEESGLAAKVKKRTVKPAAKADAVEAAVIEAPAAPAPAPARVRVKRAKKARSGPALRA